MNDMKKDVVNFRVKIDLSQFYNDERRMSYVYIDKVKITNVLHLQIRIQNIFGITRPLYLAINNVFLPANEDIRIIKEDEVVVVQSSCFGANERALTPCGSISQTEKYGSNDPKVNISATVISNVDFHDVESESYERKRKRIRRRKKNKNEPSILLPSIIQPNDSTLSNRRSLKFTFDKPNVNHLKFCWDDSDEKQCNETMKYSSLSRPIVHSTKIANLGALLSLQSSQIPPSYSGKRQIKTTSGTSTIMSSNSGSPVKMNNSDQSLDDSTVISSVDYSQINVVEYPIHNEAFEPGDIIAFQTLILNGNYCPTLSDYILAKILTKDLLTDTYSCKILLGYDQLKTPEGKFATQMDDDDQELNGNEFDQKLLTLKHSYLNQPRLIHRETPK